MKNRPQTAEVGSFEKKNKLRKLNFHFFNFEVLLL